MDTLKSIAVVSLLAAILYGVYVVANKQEQSTPESIAHELAATPPQVENGPHIDAPPRMNSNLAPPTLTAVPSSGFAHNEHDHHDHAQTAPKTLSGESSSASIYQKTEPAIAKPETPNRYDTQPAVVTNEAPSREVKSAYEKPVDELKDPTSSADAGSSSAAESPAAVPDKSASPSDNEIEASLLRARHYAFVQAWKTAQDQAMDGHFRETLLTLSAFYNDPAVTPEEHLQLVDWLDALAAKIIYGTENLLEDPYIVQRGETLYSIADRYNVPYLLLKNINGVRDPEVLLPGTKLKVVRGPFRAEVNLAKQEITLFVQNLYAGRFPFEQGNSKIAPGDYKVIAKNDKQNFHSATGTIAANDPRNAYGGVWIDLGHEVGFHGSAGDGYSAHGGSIGLATHDAQDLFGILSKGSQVTIK